jgi:pyridoxine/pyridoxamine 5'-phosphate oxidase
MQRFFKRWLPAKDEISKPKAAAWQAFGMLRREYKGEPLDEKKVDKNPIVQFSAWFNDALKNPDLFSIQITTAEKGRI